MATGRKTAFERQGVFQYVKIVPKKRNTPNGKQSKTITRRIVRRAVFLCPSGVFDKNEADGRSRSGIGIGIGIEKM